MRIGVIADIHAAPADCPPETWQGEYFPAEGAALARRAITLLKDEFVDALFVLGDSANGGDHQSMVEAIEAVSALGVPTWIVAGNVDLRLSQSALEDALAVSAPQLRIPGIAGEPFHDFVVAGLRFQGVTDDAIALDRRPDISAWKSAPVLLISHYPAISRKSEALAEDWKYSGDALGLAGLESELGARSAPTVTFHGHLHLKDTVSRGSLLQLSFPALIESGHEIAVVEIERDADSTTVAITRASTSSDSRSAAAIGTPGRSWIFRCGAWRPNSA